MAEGDSTDPRVLTDPTYSKLISQRDEAQATIARLQQEKAELDAAKAAQEPQPARIGGLNGWGPGSEETQAHKAWREAREKADTADLQWLSPKAGKAKELADAQEVLNKSSLQAAQQATKILSTNPASQTPDIRTVNGIPMERQPDGTYRPVRVAGVEGTEAASGTTTASKAGKVTKAEKGPDGSTYMVTYNVDAAGNQTWDGEAPKKLDLGTDPTAGIELQTAQVNLARAQQALAAEQDPLKKAQLQAQVEQAQFNLEQARAKAPLDLQLAQLGVQQAEQNLNKPSVSTVGGRAVGVNPNTGEVIYRTDLMSPEERAQSEEATALDLEAKRRGQLPQNAYAAYTQETSRLQETARQELARLQELQAQGAISAADAQKQFQSFFSSKVETPLAGLRAAAEEAQRAEQERIGQLQRAEDWQAFGYNQQRERLGLEAGNQARQQVMQIAPQVRTPQFLQQYGSMVANMSNRAGAKSAEEALAMPAGQRITADTFNPANFKGAIPDVEAYAKQATDRALASLSPAVAARVGGPMPQLPTGPDLPGLLSRVPYQGPLAKALPGLQPLPGQEAIDLGTGMARSMYPGGSFLDWAIA